MDTDNQSRLAAQVRSLQVITAAVAIGPIAMLIWLLATGPAQGANPAPAAAMQSTWILQGIAAGVVLIALIMPRVVLRQSLRSLAARQSGSGGPPPLDLSQLPLKLAALYTTRTILTAALIEAAAFLFLISYLLVRSPFSLVFAVMLIAQLFFQIPVYYRVRGWIEDRMFAMLGSDALA